MKKNFIGRQCPQRTEGEGDEEEKQENKRETKRLKP
jgi:hypothetical protein